MSTTSTTSSTTATATTTTSSSTSTTDPPLTATSTSSNNGVNKPKHNHHNHNHHNHNHNHNKKEGEGKESTGENRQKPKEKPQKPKPKSNKPAGDNKDQKDNKEPKEPRESREPRAPRVPREPKEPKEPKEPRQNGNNKKSNKPQTTTTTTTSTSSSTLEDNETTLNQLVNVNRFKNENNTLEPQICLICCDPIVVYSRGPCDHIDICSLCVLKQRELYSDFKCCICKSELSQVIFTGLGGKRFLEYKLSELTYSKELNIYFENKEFLEAISLLWDYNCRMCDFKSDGLKKLEYHLNTRHRQVYCEICLTDRKVFLCQQNLYDHREMPIHLAEWDGGISGDQRKIKNKGHPICKFCNKYFYGVDQLYEHLNKNHFTCFLCEKEGILYQYFKDYQKLRHHFDDEHFPCTEPDCLDKKYIIFIDEVSLRSHKVSTHFDSNTTKSQKRSVGNIRNFIDFNIQSTSNNNSSAFNSNSSSSSNNTNNSNSNSSSNSNSNHNNNNGINNRESFPTLPGQSVQTNLLGYRAPQSFNPDFHLNRSEQLQRAASQISQQELEERNKKLMTQISTMLSNDKKSEFKTKSIDFKNGKIGVNEYYTKFIALFGKSNAELIFDELVALLPDASRREELLQVHGFMKHVEDQFPSLGGSMGVDSLKNQKKKDKKNQLQNPNMWASGSSSAIHQVKKKPEDFVLQNNASKKTPTPKVTVVTTTNSNSMASKIQQHKTIIYEDSSDEEDKFPTLPTSNFSKIQIEPKSSYANTTSSTTTTTPAASSYKKSIPSNEDFPSLPLSDSPFPKLKTKPKEEPKKEQNIITKGGKKKQVFYL